MWEAMQIEDNWLCSRASKLLHFCTMVELGLIIQPVSFDLSESVNYTAWDICLPVNFAPRDSINVHAANKVRTT